EACETRAEIGGLLGRAINRLRRSGGDDALHGFAVADFDLVFFRFLAERHVEPCPAVAADARAAYPAHADIAARLAPRRHMYRAQRTKPRAVEGARLALVGKIVMGKRRRTVDPEPVEPAFRFA